MVGERTSKAKVVSAVAVYGRHYLCEVLALNRALNSVFAIGSGAPFQILSVVDVGSCEEDLVSALVSRYPAPAAVNTTYLAWRSCVTRRSSDFESTMRVQPSPGHRILAASPSS